MGELLCYSGGGVRLEWRSCCVKSGGGGVRLELKTCRVSVEELDYSEGSGSGVEYTWSSRVKVTSEE